MQYMRMKSKIVEESADDGLEFEEKKQPQKKGFLSLGSEVALYKKSSTLYAKKSDPSAQLSDFEIIRILGQGAFGKVFLVKKKDTGKLYAMKSQAKYRIIDEFMIKEIIEEKNILQQADHPFLVGLHYMFQTE